MTRHVLGANSILILPGVAILLGTLTPFVIVLAFAVVLDLRFVRAEELKLAKTFANDWQIYRRDVRRWI